MKPILMIAAVPQETILLEHAFSNTSRKKSPAYDYVEGELGKQRLILCAGGVGKINAAAVTSALIERFRPRLVINLGCAGAYPGSGLSIGDLAVASEEILGDEGVLTSKGWQDLSYMNLPALVQGSRRYYNSIPLSKHAAEKAMQLADCYGVKLVRGRFVTISTCSGSKQRGEELAGQFGAVSENMEGAAVALTCLRYSINCLEIRGISNMVEERDIRGWDIPRAVEAAQRFVLKYLEELDRTKPERTNFKAREPV
jgi:futalosine hydrolase